MAGLEHGIQRALARFPLRAVRLSRLCSKFLPRFGPLNASPCSARLPGPRKNEVTLFPSTFCVTFFQKIDGVRFAKFRFIHSYLFKNSFNPGHLCNSRSLFGLSFWPFVNFSKRTPRSSLPLIYGHLNNWFPCQRSRKRSSNPILWYLFPKALKMSCFCLDSCPGNPNTYDQPVDPDNFVSMSLFISL